MYLSVAIVRILFGLFFFANGLNLWLGFIHIEQPQSGPGYILMEGLVGSGLFDYVKYVEIFTGFLLLVNRFVPFSLLMMAPLIAVIVYVDFVLIKTSQTYLFGALALFPWSFLSLAYLSDYLPMMKMKVQPKFITLPEIRSSIFGSGK